MFTNPQQKCHTLNAYVIFMLFATSSARKQRDYKDIPPNEYDEEGCLCVWTNWMNNNDYNPLVGDDTTYENLRKSYSFCENPVKIICREKKRWYVPYEFLHASNTICSVKTGLKCVSKPFMPAESGESSYYCNDFEVTVLCCSCSTSAAATVTTAYQTKNKIINTTNSTESAIIISFDQSRTSGSSRHDESALTIILLSVVGGIAFAALAIIIYLIIQKYSASNNNKDADLSFYQEVEAPNDEPTPLMVGDDDEFTKVRGSQLSGSSDYITTTSEDEGYRSRPSYGNRKLKTKRQRNKDKRRIKRSNNVRKFANTSDSSEFPLRDMHSPGNENNHNDNGRLRIWFPDEYGRALEQNTARNQSRKKRSKFIPSFQAKAQHARQFQEIV